jgi:hypothetical protein
MTQAIAGTWRELLVSNAGVHLKSITDGVSDQENAGGPMLSMRIVG